MILLCSSRAVTIYLPDNRTLFGTVLPLVQKEAADMLKYEGGYTAKQRAYCGVKCIWDMTGF